MTKQQLVLVTEHAIQLMDLAAVQLDGLEVHVTNVTPTIMDPLAQHVCLFIDYFHSKLRKYGIEFSKYQLPYEIHSACNYEF